MRSMSLAAATHNAISACRRLARPPPRCHRARLTVARDRTRNATSPIPITSNNHVLSAGVPVETSAQEPQYRQTFEAMTQQSADALVVNGFAPNFTYRHFIAELALRHRLPSICWYRDVTKAQGILAYEPDFDNIVDRLADQADQILKGAKPADIPIYQPTKFTLAINLKTARALGLNIPSTLLASADEVIE
jgi:putative tryptophan/tyrosine transport system substrate-binding protein